MCLAPQSLYDLKLDVLTMSLSLSLSSSLFLFLCVSRISSQMFSPYLPLAFSRSHCIFALSLPLAVSHPSLSLSLARRFKGRSTSKAEAPTQSGDEPHDDDGGHEGQHVVHDP